MSAAPAAATGVSLAVGGGSQGVDGLEPPMTLPACSLADLFPWIDLSEGVRLVTGLASDSRKVVPGSVFVAMAGTKADGSAFVADAVARGVSAIIGEAPRPDDLPAPVAYIQVGNARAALAMAAARLHPAQPDHIVAITGTSGKSSVADFTRQLLASLGLASASLGTLGIVTASGAAYGSLTTPDPITLHATLDRLAGQGITHLAMEASSHGLVQHRLDGVRLEAAAFTNLGRDHLDYHATMEEYLDAKMELFRRLLAPGRPAVVNADGAFADQAVAVARARGLLVLTTGYSGDTVKLLQARADGFTQRLTLLAPGRSSASTQNYEVTLPLVGGFQVENALLAAGLTIATNEGRAPEIIAGLAGLAGVPGRLERVGEVNGALVIVDYAHKPEALAHVLDSLRPFASGRLVCVFGCGGDRDRGKRPIMGGIAAEKADLVIVTDDNPRSEDPATIRSEILAAAPDAREIGDRTDAIREAIRGLRSGDVLVVAGKGHEPGQIIADRTLPFSDHDVARTAIAELT